MSTEPCDLNLAEARAALDAREISAGELAESCLARIARVEPSIAALLAVTGDRARAEAVAADARRARGERGALLGIPIVLKDLLATRGLPTTCASRILEGWHPPYDADCVERLGRAGAVLVGKANLDEFAMGSSTENSAFGPTRTPWDPSRVPGGSSGGSAAAVAAGECLAALGTDTGGSIRLPASFTGTCGLKPTYGRVSRYGLIAYASSLDQVGPITRSARDAAAVLGVIAGHDPRDATSSSEPVPDYEAALSGDVRGLRIGVPREYFPEELNAEVRCAVEASIEQLTCRGARRVDVSLPHSRYAVATYYLIAPAEASSNLARYDGVRFGLRISDDRDDLTAMYQRTRDAGFGGEVKRRILLGTWALSSGYYDAYYVKAQRMRALVRQDFEQAFAACDLLLAPTAATTAFRLGERALDPLAMYLSDVFTIAANLAELPGLSIPCGFDAAGLPIGLQMLGRWFDEATLLRAADALERDSDWHRRRPPLPNATEAA